MNCLATDTDETVTLTTDPENCLATDTDEMVTLTTDPDQPVTLTQVGGNFEFT
jgi:hypothetical protein